MVEIDDYYNLIFNYSKDRKIIINEELLNRLDDNDLNSLPEKTSLLLESIEFFVLKFNDERRLKLFKFFVNCKFKDLENPIKIFSFEHLKMILDKKIKENIYKNPFYISKNSGEIIYIDTNKIESYPIYLDEYIEIKDMALKDMKSKINSIITDLNKLYSNDEKSKYTYKFISPNFKNYIPKLNIDLSDEFYFIDARNRITLKNKIESFLNKENTEFLYPLCGPHGSGKTISILLFHKLLFREHIKGLYINFKYYLQKGITLKDKIETLLKECYFICDNKNDNDLLGLYEKMIVQKNFYELIAIINDFIQKKNKNQSDKIYVILDQYQEKYNINNILSIFNNTKIIVFSSINDFDVKENLILNYENSNEKKNKKKEDNNITKSKIFIRYNYIDDLINKKYYDLKTFKELIKKKIKKNHEENKIKEENEVKEGKNEINDKEKNKIKEEEKKK